MRLFTALVVLVLTVATALPALAERVSDFTLDNGLQLVVIEDRRAPVVVHAVWYRVGAADEMPGKSGIAHFLEHLMFKGTETTEPGAFSTAVEALGGSDNAFASWDYTGYFQRVASEHLGLMMQMEADRMVNLTLDLVDVATERSVVLEERGQRVDADPAGLFGEQRRAALYLNHPYGRPIIGWRHEIEGLTREDALAFYRTHYAPNNAIVIVAGDVDPGEALVLARDHYGAIPANPDLAPRSRPAEPPHLSERRLQMEDARVRQPYLIRSYLAPARRSGDQAEAAALLVLADLLGGSSATSILGLALEFDSRVAIQASAFYDATALDDTIFGLVVAPVEGVTLQEAEAAMDAAISRFLDEGVDDAAFVRVMSRLRAAEIYAMDRTQGVAQRYGVALTSGLTVQDQRDWPAVLQAVTPEAVMTAAGIVFDRRRSVTGYLVKEVTQ